MADETEPLMSNQYSSQRNSSTASNLARDGYLINDVRDTIPKSKEKTSHTNLVLAICACIFGSPLQIGLNTAILNAPQEVIKSFYNETYNDRYGKNIESSLLTLLWAVTVSFFCIGGMLGGVLSPGLAGKYGRKRILLLNNLIAFMCAALQGSSKMAKSFEMLIAGRIVAGVCCGVASAVAPLYLAEISPISLRGFCGTCNQLSITIGVVLGEALGLSNVLGTESLWPVLVVSPAVPAIYSFLTLSWCPESPRYLMVMKEDQEGANKAMMWLRNSTDVEEEMETIHKEMVEHRNSPKFTLKDLVKTIELRRPLIICIVLQMSQQLSGINAVIYYSTSIFASAGLSSAASQYATLGTGLVNVSMTFVSALIMDKAGRRTLHMTGLGGMCCFSVLLVVCLSLQPDAAWLSYISIVAVVIYIVFFATGPGSIPWFMVAELFAQGPRTAAVSVSVVVNWLCNFIVGIIYPLLQTAIKTYSFLPFSVMLALFFIFTYMFVPETKGKSITEITMIFRDPTDASSASLFQPSTISYEIIIEEGGSTPSFQGFTNGSYGRDQRRESDGVKVNEGDDESIKPYLD